MNMLKIPKPKQSLYLQIYTHVVCKYWVKGHSTLQKEKFVLLLNWIMLGHASVYHSIWSTASLLTQRCKIFQ